LPSAGQTLGQLACKLIYIYPNAFADTADYTAA
jgi:hypothetical protein